MVQTSDYLKLRITCILSLGETLFVSLAGFAFFIIHMETMSIQIIKRLHFSTNHSLLFKVIPQKTKLSNDFLETFPECSLLIPVLRTTIKKMSPCLLKRYNGLILPH